MPQTSGPFPPVLPSLPMPCPAVSGHGSPNGVVPATPGTRFTDIDTGNQWMKMQSTGVNGWFLVGAVGGAGIEVVG